MTIEIERQAALLHLNISKLLELEQGCIWKGGKATLSQFSAQAQKIIESTGELLAQFRNQEMDGHWGQFREITDSVKGKKEATEEDPGLKVHLEKLVKICRQYQGEPKESETWEFILKSALQRGGFPEHHALSSVDVLLRMDPPTRTLMVEGLKNQHAGKANFPQTYVIRTLTGQLQLLMFEFPKDFDEWIQDNQLSPQILNQIAAKS